QKHIKKLSCFTSNDSIPKLIKEALLLHANNLVEYTSIGCCDLDYSLSDFKSLKSLNMQRCSLVNDFDDIFDENLKLNLLEKINVSIEGQDCVYTLNLFCALMTALPQQIKILSFRQKCLLLDD
ncbi:6983_t:CDS:2, partial [Entrophospora sp. SA101]